jgi:hypothetical protein
MSEALSCADRLNRSFPPTPLKDEAADHIRRLEAECEALRKDAERYRWILRNYLSADLTDLALKAGNLDAAIDAAMGKDKA